MKNNFLDVPSALLSDVAAAGKAGPTMLVLADYLEDHGEPVRAAFWRWAHEHGLFPFRGERNWAWWEEDYSRTGPDDHSNVPQALFCKLDAPASFSVGSPTIQGAFTRLERAWLSLAEAERATLADYVETVNMDPEQ